MAIAFKSVSAALALSLASLAPAAVEKNDVPNPRQEALEKNKNEIKAEQAPDRAANQKTLVAVAQNLKQDNPAQALKEILKIANFPDSIKFMQNGLRANQRSDLLVLDQDALAKAMKLEDPTQAKAALEKLLYRPAALEAAQNIRKLIDESLTGKTDPEIFNKIRVSAGMMKLEIPGLLTNGSLASKEGFLEDLKKVHDKLPEADRESDLVKKSYAALIRDFRINP